MRDTVVLHQRSKTFHVLGCYIFEQVLCRSWGFVILVKGGSYLESAWPREIEFGSAWWVSADCTSFSKGPYESPPLLPFDEAFGWRGKFPKVNELPIQYNDLSHAQPECMTLDINNGSPYISLLQGHSNAWSYWHEINAIYPFQILLVIHAYIYLTLCGLSPSHQFLCIDCFLYQNPVFMKTKCLLAFNQPIISWLRQNNFQYLVAQS